MKNIDLYQLISALSYSVDLAEQSLTWDNNYFESIPKINSTKHQFLNHSKRTCYISMKIAKLINTNEVFLNNVFISSILHDLGATGRITESHTEEKFIFHHSTKGSNLMKKLPLIGSTVVDAIKYHHENYDGSGYFSLKGDEIPLEAQIIRLSDTFELLYDETSPNFVQRDHIIDWITEHKNLFSPYLMDALIEVQSKDAFWWDIQNIGSVHDILSRETPKISLFIDLSDLKNIAKVFADIIDTKSPFTYKHSTNLTKLISNVSDYLSFNEVKKTRYEISALMHDIGKLAVPNRILDKNDKLDHREYTIIKSHTYYTRLVLSKIDGFGDIVNWASNHHEKLNGKGYPFGLTGDLLSLEERIMAVCDIYEALTADRPYKKGIGKDATLGILNNLVDKSEICNEALSIVKNII